MRRASNTFAALVIAVAEIAALGMAAAPASAQDVAQQRRTIAQQQRLILQQQKQILENQRQLAAQQQQISRPGAVAAAPADLNRGIFGNIGNCPAGYTYNLFNGCLPTVVVLH